MKRKLIAIFAVVALLLTLLAIPVFADTETTESAVTTGSTETTGEVKTDGGDNVVDDPFDLSDGETTEESTGLSAVALWNIVIGGIALAIVIVLVIVFFVLPSRREKTLKFFRSLKSEWKKISWYSWKQTWKGTLVVAIVSIVIAIVVGLLDTGFSQGLNALAKFF